MKNLLKFLVSNIVSQPKDVTIEKEEEENFINLKLKVNPEDVKIVIGKKGRTIRAIRDLLRLKAGRQGKKINLLLEE